MGYFDYTEVSLATILEMIDELDAEEQREIYAHLKPRFEEC